MDKKNKLLLGIFVLLITISGVCALVLKMLDTSPIKNELNHTEPEKNKIENFNSENNYKNYVNNNFNIKFTYPNNYKLNEGLLGSIVTVYSEKENYEDLFVENLNIVTEDLSGRQIKMNLDEYTDLNIAQLEAMFDDFKIISSKKTELSKLPAYEIIHTSKSEQGKYLKFRQIWTIYNDIAYVITYTAEENKFDKYFENFDKIFTSFELLN